ncbi:MAG: YdcF family protein [Oscillospiraceae bacterium]|nr:YdcF family protein [Oscillospiraceae bacterium]
MKRGTRKRNTGRGRVIIFAVLVLLLAALLLLRILRTGPGAAIAEEMPAPTVASAQTVPPKTEETEALPEEAPVPESTEAEPTLSDAAEEKPTPQATPTPVNPKSPVPTGAGGYNKTTYEIVSDMVYTYRQLQSEGMDTVRRDLEKLKAADPALGTAWERIMETWVYVNNDLEIFDAIPAGLPEDDSLAIVALGFQLLPDGSMDPELVSRCELAMSCAETYPNAYVIVTGGGTALDNKEMTEAQAMADWFIQKGLDPDRLIVETRAMTTGQNAQYSCEILMAEYPQVNNLLLVTSDYHMQMAWLLFSEEAYLYECAYGVAPYVLAGNASVHIPDATDEYNGTSKQAQYLWTLADPQY